MAASIYNRGAGCTGVVATTATSAATSKAFVSGPVLAAALSTTDDQIAMNTMTICHTGTTDGTTVSASWLHVKVTYYNGSVSHDILLPGERQAYKCGFDNSAIGAIELWTLTPGSATLAGAANVQVIIGGMVKQ